MLSTQDLKTFSDGTPEHIKSTVIKGRTSLSVDITLKKNESRTPEDIFRLSVNLIENANEAPITVYEKRNNLIFLDSDDITNELIDSHILKSYQGEKTYGGYKNILRLLNINHMHKTKTDIANLLRNNRKVDPQSNDKYNAILRFVTNPRYNNIFTSLHSRLRFLDRFILYDRVDIYSDEAVDKYIQNFLTNLANTDKISIAQYYSDKSGATGCELTIQTDKNRKCIIGINKDLTIHTTSY